MFQFITAFAAVSGLVSVALGAFGAHALRDKLDPRLLHAFETAVLYQFIHTLALLACALLVLNFERVWAFRCAGYAFMLGILLFSGSLYLLAVTEVRWLGPVTPLGGLFLMVGWALLLLGSFSLDSGQNS